MRRRSNWQIVVVMAVALLALYVVLDVPRPEWVKALLFWQPPTSREIAIRLGLDLQGGLQILLAADVPAGQELDTLSMETARRIVENRVNGLGLTEPIVQALGERRIIVELPGIENPEQAVETIRGTALLEFVHAGSVPLAPGTLITTTLGGPAPIVTGTLSEGPGSAASPTPVAESDISPTATLVPAQSPITAAAAFSPTEITPIEPLAPSEPTAEPPRASGVYETILTGAGIKQVGLDVQQGEYNVPFELNPDAAEIFAAYTAAHVNDFLCIVLDKQVISCPRVNGPIPGGRAMITGKFTYDEARQLSIQLRYGALPVPLRVESFNRVGATLGAESVERSVRAGVIGLVVVLAFMLVYYRLSGALADLALVIYVLLNLALYKLAPVTLTLPGIAGFLLSAGMAVDANILIFERMKEELRNGRSLMMAIEIGFSRAWPSIRDAQASTLIICAILFLFGTNFGASIVKGFAVTLAIGTVINLFTAVFATRTFVRQVAMWAGNWLVERAWLLGV
jgi:protein-export membrane protein SecD